MKTGCLLLALVLFAPCAVAQERATVAGPPLTDQEMEQFLLHASTGRARSAGKGVSGSQRVTLKDGAFAHDAHVQTIDEQKAQGPAPGGRTEYNFRDSWIYNIAAYRLDRLIGLNLVPVSVERRWHNEPAAFTWWVDDVMMDEQKRTGQKLTPPNVEAWNQEIQLVRLFDQLIYNVDSNLGNLLITKDWRVWAIDHTRAFRVYTQLRSPREISRCDREVLAKLRQLDRATLNKALGRYLSRFEIDGLLARRDAIVALIDSLGPSGVFDRVTPH